MVGEGMRHLVEKAPKAQTIKSVADLCRACLCALAALRWVQELLVARVGLSKSRRRRAEAEALGKPSFTCTIYASAKATQLKKYGPIKFNRVVADLIALLAPIGKRPSHGRVAYDHRKTRRLSQQVAYNRTQSEREPLAVLCTRLNQFHAGN